jgi:SAM-dependent methyltransferase
MSEWFANEDFWQTLYPFLFSSETLAKGETEVEQVLGLVKFSGRRVLDMCCGPGRHSVPLAKKGLQVTAVDLSPFLLDVARSRAEKEQVEIEWIRDDMRYFCRDAAYDLIINLYTSFGYFQAKEEDILVLKNIHRSLRPGGTCVLELVAKEWIAGNIAEALVHDLSDGAILVERPKVVDDWTRIDNQWIYIRDGQAKTFKFSHTIFSGQEMRQGMERAGFSSVELFGSLHGDEFGPEAQRLVVVGRK